MTKIAVANGDGIGPEIMEAVLSVFKAAKVPLEYDFVDMGKWVFDKGYSNLVEHIGNLERALGFVYGRTYGRPLKYD